MRTDIETDIRKPPGLENWESQFGWNNGEPRFAVRCYAHNSLEALTGPDHAFISALQNKVLVPILIRYMHFSSAEGGSYTLVLMDLVREFLAQWSSIRGWVPPIHQSFDEYVDFVQREEARDEVGVAGGDGVETGGASYLGSSW
jgi:hypothetical protein